MTVQMSRRPRRRSSELDPLSAAHIYYGPDSDRKFRDNSRRTSFSTVRPYTRRAPPIDDPLV